MKRLAHTLAYLPVALAVLVTVSLLLIPAQRTLNCETSSGQAVCADRSATLVESMGWGIVLLLLLPVLFAGLPLVLSGRSRRVAFAYGTVLMFGFVALAVTSVGLFFLPAAVAMLLVTVIDPRRPTPASGAGQEQ